MTRDDVIRMAREAGVFFSVPDVCPAEPLEHHVQAVERFAALVAEHEREQCARLCENLGDSFLKRQDPKSHDLSDVMMRQIVVLGWNGAAEQIRARR